MQTAVKSNISFDAFTVDPIHRVLLKKGEIVNLNPKTFDLLLALIERQGEVVSKSELLDAVWGEQFVEEGNLTVNVSLLRKALGENKNEHRYIVTVPGVGYSFVAEIEEEADEIIIERHSLEQILIEEEIEEDEHLTKQNAALTNSHLPVAQTSQTEIPFKNLRKEPKLLYFALGALAILVAAAFWIYNKSEISDDQIYENLNIRTYSTEGMPRYVTGSPSGKLLAYIGRRKGLESVWVGNVSTGNNIRITEPSNIQAMAINFSPDEEYIYFVKRTESEPEWILSRVSVFGGAVQEIIRNVHSTFTFSPDGEKVAFIRRENSQGSNSLIVADAKTGTDEKVLLNLKNPQDFSMNAVSWSPDGEKIAIIALNEKGGNFALTLVNPADGTKEKLGNGFWSRSTGINWQKDGKGLIIVHPTKYGHNGVSQIWQVHYPDGTERQITKDLNNYDPRSLSVSANGKIATLLYRIDPQIWISPTLENYLDDELVVSGTKTNAPGLYGLAMMDDGKVLFTSSLEESQTIWAMNADGTNPKQLTPTENGAKDSQFVLTKDNRFVFFQSNRSGATEIWRIKSDGTNLKQITSGGGNAHPTVTPDGKWIIYTHYESVFPKLYRISTDGGKAELFSNDLTSEAIVSPDGKFVAASYGLPRDAYLPKIAVFPIEGGSPVKIIPVPDGILYNRLRWSPDSRSLICKDSKQGLWRINAESGEREKIELMDDFRVTHLAWSKDGNNFVYSGGIEVHEVVILDKIR